MGLQRLVAFVALYPGTTRSRLTSVLWPEAAPQQSQANLRTQLWRTNGLVPDLLATSDGCVRWGRRVQVDVDWLVEYGVRMLRNADEVLNQRDQDTLCTADGELLPDWDQAWITVERERLHQLRLHVLEASAVRLAAAGHYGLALESALASLGADELRESAHATVIRVHLVEGNVAEARRAYDRYAALARSELGVEPSPDLASLVGATARSSPRLRPRPRSCCF